MRCYIGIGSNLGDRKKNINMALDKLKSRKGVEIEKISSIIETEPVGEIDQPDEAVYGPSISCLTSA